ncbi:hypothetical protein MM2B1231_2789 [Mycobacteroides abscessus subsp. bolletii 2B-1231]|uniref:Uncharacterized protein n=1 Tax=Mycobacteroides abscessus MAB_091912_2446 TaxID=1335414 RepID=A0A829MDG5_9MYCO|nr:hypothetical protein MM2B0626_2723 [Mycobacteroides abscessus subsp. bolletii 2B-0626]EIV11054.1 hypothetical protein MM2B0307_2035 [Mycobacteroides abscessus subsp. bolletii 2B-0307]EIV11929.1 hypothetical protein MM2B0912R_3126 [Mycobacteroides abscessus subsp. bolletii 2B-0912-R]EIV19987.1 hypothetical protein MM2B0912S_2730 [Mycobacteroides abscessus subsp. bolletii 2B-0912-S]EIV74760.1 hypothetical protein MM2B1231_2789 [Mycobacteroides abscessus subsp. bolletii 2B-1231]EIV79029.1 hypo
MLMPSSVPHFGSVNLGDFRDGKSQNVLSGYVAVLTAA